mgnify:CR=1 FL=1
MVELLRANSELRKDRVWNWTLPAWVVKLPDGRNVNVCPQAGACKDFCYARNGTYLFPTVRHAHLLNLQFIMDDLSGWSRAMTLELADAKFRPTGRPRFTEQQITDLSLDQWAANWSRNGGAAVRIHDSGDFFSDEYLDEWLKIADRYPEILFYAYTKEVTRFRERVQNPPSNFRYLFSMGGKLDSKIQPELDRHAEVFASFDDIAAAGYLDQTDNDLLAVLLPTTRVGIPANNIPHFNKKLAGRTFGEAQNDRRRAK